MKPAFASATRRPSLLAPALLALSCSPSPAAPPPSAPPPAPPSTATAALAPSPPTTAPETKDSSKAPEARVGVPVSARFALAVDCKAYGLDVWPVGRGLLGICGSNVEGSAVFYIPEGGPPRLAPEVLKGMPMGRTREGNGLGLAWVSGPDLDHLTARVADLHTRAGATYSFEKNGQTWKRTGSTPEGTDDGAARDYGGVQIGGRRLVEGFEGWFYEDKKPGWFPRSVKSPECSDAFYPYAVLSVIGANLWGVSTCEGNLFAQRWTVGHDDSAVFPLGLPGVEGHQYGRISPLGSAWLFTLLGSTSAALFDGTSWHSLAPLPDTTYANSPPTAVGGRTWLFGDGPLLRFDGKGFDPLPVPGGTTQHVTTTPAGDLRIMTPTGSFALGADDTWHPVPEPTLPASAHPRPLEKVGEAWVLRVEFDKEVDHGQLFVDGMSGAPLHIENPGAAVSPVAYVTALGASCEDPFAMLYKIGKTAPRNYDYPATRAALKDRPDFASVHFSEVEAFGDRYLVAHAKGKRQLQVLSRLVAHLREQVKGSKPQLLCADRVPSPGLPVSREIDLR